MKENVLDVLMYLFEHYMYEETEFNPDRDRLLVELSEAGFPYNQINKAFDWLEGLNASYATLKERGASTAIRVYSPREIRKLDAPCRGFLLYLEQIEIFKPADRELVIDRIMALETTEIDLEELKWVILMVFFNQPGNEAAYHWMEELMLNTEIQSLH